MTNPEHRRVHSYRREWARRLIARGNPPGTLVPAYGSPAWCALPESDPARIAAVVLAAEAWAWTSDTLPELPATVRGDGPGRQGVATPGEQARSGPDPEQPDHGGDGSATPGSTPRQGDGHPRQRQHPDHPAPDNTPGGGYGDGPATPGSQGGQP